MNQWHNSDGYIINLNTRIIKKGMDSQQEQFQSDRMDNQSSCNEEMYQKQESQDNSQYDFDEDMEEFKSGKQRIRPVYPCKRIKTIQNLIRPLNRSRKIIQYSRLQNSGRKQQEEEFKGSIASSQKLKITKRQLSSKNDTEDTQEVKRKEAKSKSIRPKQKKETKDVQQAKETPIPPNVDLNKIISQVMLQNNQHFHRVNQNVVNRLLTIIETNQEMAMTNLNMSMSMKNSRWSTTNGKSSEVAYLDHSNAKHASRRQIGPRFRPNEETQQSNYQVKRSPKEPPSASRPPQLEDQPQNTSTHPFSSPNTITINNIIPTSTKSQPNTIPNNLNSSIKKKQIQLGELENRRNRRSREFNYRTPRMSELDDAYQTPAQTPRDHCDRSAIESRNRNRKSMQCDQILETPFQNQREDSNEFSLKESQIQNRQMGKTNKIQQIEIGSSTIQMSQLNSTKEDQFKSEASIQLPIASTNQTKGSTSIEDHLIESQMVYKKPVFIEIPSDENKQFGAMSLAEAFKKRIGKLPSRAERKEKQLKQESNQAIKVKDINTIVKPAPARSKERPKKEKNTSLQVDVRSLKKRNEQNMMTTPKSCEPSEQLLNRLIGGSKAKVTKKQMYALTRKNYQNLPEVQQRKKNELKKQLQLQRIERIKQYQKSIRASKTTIASNN